MKLLPFSHLATNMDHRGVPHPKIPALLAKHDPWIAGSLLSHDWPMIKGTTASCEKDDASPIFFQTLYSLYGVYICVIYIYTSYIIYNMWFPVSNTYLWHWVAIERIHLQHRNSHQAMAEGARLLEPLTDAGRFLFGRGAEVEPPQP